MLWCSLLLYRDTTRDDICIDWKLSRCFEHRVKEDGSACCSVGGPHPRVRLDKDYDGMEGFQAIMQAGPALNKYLYSFGRQPDEADAHSKDVWRVPLRVSEDTLVSELLAFAEKRMVSGDRR